MFKKISYKINVNTTISLCLRLPPNDSIIFYLFYRNNDTRKHNIIVFSESKGFTHHLKDIDIWQHSLPSLLTSLDGSSAIRELHTIIKIKINMD